MLKHYRDGYMNQLNVILIANCSSNVTNKLIYNTFNN